MAQAICPHCQKKLQLPEAMAPGMMLQCAGCNAQFLPPEPEIVLREVRSVKKKKFRKRKEREPISVRSIILVCSLVAIVLLLGTLGAIWLMQPSHAKFNEQVVQNYQKFSTIMEQGMDLRRITNVQTMLQQFEKMAPQLTDTLEQVRNLRAPEDFKGVQGTFVSLLEATQRFGRDEVPGLLKKLKSSNEKAIAQDMAISMYRIASLHENLIEQQHQLAKTHGLLQIQVPKNRQSFLSSLRSE